MNTYPTIKDVASTAGVSIGTVSRVINQKLGVSPTAETVVRNAMVTLGYHPPPLKNRRGPKPGQRHENKEKNRVSRIGMFVVGIPAVQLQSPIYSHLLNGVHSATAAAGKTLVLNMLDGSDLEALRQALRQVDGAVFFCSPDAGNAIAPHRGNFSVQVFGEIKTGEWWDHVTYRNSAIGPMAASWLLERGHATIAMIGSNGPATHFRERQIGFREACPAAQLFVSQDVILAPNRLNQVNRDIMASLVDDLLRTKPRPTGLFVPADMQAVVVQSLLLERGVVVGHDMEIISVNNEELLLAGLHPRPATIDIHAERVGRRAVEQVLWRIDHPDEPAVHQTIEPEVRNYGGSSRWQFLGESRRLTTDFPAQQSRNQEINIFLQKKTKGTKEETKRDRD